ncbi:MAG: Gfo/Idh/MocA family oxidoreductase [Emcibacteraceae bacterium]
MYRVLVVGVGLMGFAHAKACAALPDTKIVGLVARDFRKWQPVKDYFPDVPLYNDFDSALEGSNPDVVIISSFTDTHAPYAIKAMEAGAHVFVEKPLSTTIHDAGRTIVAARKYNRKLYVGLILRHHALWQKFCDCVAKIGTPINVTMTSHQHSTGDDWQHHKNILSAGLSPIVDVGIHYADLMIRLMGGEVANIRARGTKTNAESPAINDISLKISYSDGSVLNLESGLGPEISPNRPNIKQATGPGGMVRITPENTVQVNDESFSFADTIYDQAILEQQKYFFDVIKNDRDMEDHYNEVALGMATVLIAEQEMIKT